MGLFIRIEWILKSYRIQFYNFFEYSMHSKIEIITSDCNPYAVWWEYEVARSHKCPLPAYSCRLWNIPKVWCPVARNYAPLSSPKVSRALSVTCLFNENETDIYFVHFSESYDDCNVWWMCNFSNVFFHQHLKNMDS